MQTIENQTASGITIVLDDKHYMNCKFDHCQVVYNGGDWQLTNSILNECQFIFNGPAQRTALLLSVINLNVPPGSTRQ